MDDVGFRSLAQHFINLRAPCGKVDVSDRPYIDRTSLTKSHLLKACDEILLRVSVKSTEDILKMHMRHLQFIT